MCGRPTEPSPAIRATCSQVTGTPSSWSLATMRLGARHPVVADQLALAGEFGLVGVEEVGEHVQAHAVEPAGEFGAGDEGEPARAAAATASACPPVVSWSVSATTSRPAAAALRTSSAGVSVPSEAVEWVCRSMRTTRAPGSDGRNGDAQG